MKGILKRGMSDTNPTPLRVFCWRGLEGPPGEQPLKMQAAAFHSIQEGGGVTVTFVTDSAESPFSKKAPTPNKLRLSAAFDNCCFY